MPLTAEEILQSLMHNRVRLTSAAWLMVRDTHIAEDLFQNTALKAMTSKSQFDNPATLLSWCSITLRHECIDWLRKHQRDAVVLDESIVALVDSEWERDERNVSGTRLDMLRTCMEHAESEVQRIMRLRYFENLSCSEVAIKLSTNLSTVYKRLSRAHASLKACVERKLSLVAENPLHAQ